MRPKQAVHHEIAVRDLSNPTQVRDLLATPLTTVLFPHVTNIITVQVRAEVLRHLEALAVVQPANQVTPHNHPFIKQHPIH